MNNKQQREYAMRRAGEQTAQIKAQEKIEAFLKFYHQAQEKEKLSSFLKFSPDEINEILNEIDKTPELNSEQKHNIKEQINNLATEIREAMEAGLKETEAGEKKKINIHLKELGNQLYLLLKSFLPVKTAELYKKYSREDYLRQEYKQEIYIKDDVYQQYLDWIKQGKSAVVWGDTKSGKTDMLFHLQSERSVRQKYFPLYVACEKHWDEQINTELDLWGRIIRMLKQVKLIDDEVIIASYQDFIEQIKQAEGRIGRKKLLLMLDDLQYVEYQVLKGEISPDIYNKLQELGNRDKIVFLLSVMGRMDKLDPAFKNFLEQISQGQRIKEKPFIPKKEIITDLIDQIVKKFERYQQRIGKLIKIGKPLEWETGSREYILRLTGGNLGLTNWLVSKLMGRHIFWIKHPKPINKRQIRETIFYGKIDDIFAMVLSTKYLNRYLTPESWGVMKGLCRAINLTSDSYTYDAQSADAYISLNSLVEILNSRQDTRKLGINSLKCQEILDRLIQEQIVETDGKGYRFVMDLLRLCLSQKGGEYGTIMKGGQWDIAPLKDQPERVGLDEESISSAGQEEDHQNELRKLEAKLVNIEALIKIGQEEINNLKAEAEEIKKKIKVFKEEELE